MIRYSSSLGIAAGSTAQEAHLHGLCELIEHDALSHALLRWFIARMPRANVVDVPGPVKPLRDLAAEAVGSQVLLFDVTTISACPPTWPSRMSAAREPGRWARALPRSGSTRRHGPWAS